jgi:predicted RNA-binding Zn ribbon-like protein
LKVAEKPLFDLTLTGQLSLDFANTVDWRTSEQPLELINTYADLVRWARHTGLVKEREARRLTLEAARHPVIAGKVLSSALVLREALHRIFSAIAEGQKPSSSDMKYLNGRLSDALGRLQIVSGPEGYKWDWKGREAALDWLLWPVLRAAADLLTSNQLEILRQCPGAGCAWLFVDTSRNGSRRWCAMGVCGNRAKARRHYEQAKAAQ